MPLSLSKPRRKTERDDVLDLLRAGPPKFDRRLGPFVPFVLGTALLGLDGVLIWQLRPFIWQGTALALIACSILAAIGLLIYAVLAARMEAERYSEDYWYLFLEKVEKTTLLKEQHYREVAQQAIADYEDARDARWAAEDDHR